MKSIPAQLSNAEVQYKLSLTRGQGTNCVAQGWVSITGVEYTLSLTQNASDTGAEHSVWHRSRAQTVYDIGAGHKLCGTGVSVYQRGGIHTVSDAKCVWHRGRAQCLTQGQCTNCLAQGWLSYTRAGVQTVSDTGAEYKVSHTGLKYKVCFSQGWSTKCVSHRVGVQSVSHRVGVQSVSHTGLEYKVCLTHRVVAQTVSNIGVQSDTRVGYKLTIFLGLCLVFLLFFFLM